MLSQSLASIIDQFLLSGLNFGIGILLIRLATKEEYGAYTQLFAAGLLAATLLEAFLGTTLTTLVARKESKEQSKMIVAAKKLQHRLSIGMALFFGIGGAAFLHNLKEENIIVIEIGLAFGLYIFTLTQREFRRTLYFLKHKATDVLKLDFAFVVY